MKTIIRAVYRDEHGRTYSAPVEFYGDKWLMRTSEGLQAIEHFFDHDNAGRLTFDHYREDPEEPDTQSADLRLPHENSFQQLHRIAATELSREDLARSPRLRVLLEAQSKPLPASESADAYLAAHPELRDRRVSPLMQREIAQRQITAEFFKKSTEATAAHDGTKFTDYNK